MTVVSLRGEPVQPRFGEPQPGLVELCKALLAEAESGMLQGLAAAEVRADCPGLSLQTSMFAPSGQTGTLLIAAVAKLSHHLANTHWPDHGR